MTIADRIRKAFNAFRSYDEEHSVINNNVGPGSSQREPSTTRRYFNERSIISSIYTRISIDVAGVAIRHVQMDDGDRYVDDMDTSLNNCLTYQANLDQSPRAFRQDIIRTLFDEGVVAIVPVNTSLNPEVNNGFEIYDLRVGVIKAWHPKHVRVSLYNELTGLREEIMVEKKYTAIIENPLYSVMNEPSSTLQRLIRKLQLLDVVDEQSSSGKLDIIIQLPYVVKTEARRQQAEQRRTDIEMQLKGSQYGIAYADGTEKITQLNRPAENNLLKQVEFLTAMLYGQLGLTEAIMNGTADERTMIAYFNRTIEPLLDAMVEAMQVALLGELGTKRKEKIKYFRDPFKLVPLGEIAEIADKFTRNEILTSNELRSYMGIAPSKDPKADKLTNSNMPQPPPVPPGPSFEDMDGIINKVFDGLGSDIDKLAKGVSSG